MIMKTCNEVVWQNKLLPIAEECLKNSVHKSLTYAVLVWVACREDLGSHTENFEEHGEETKGRL